MDDKKIYEVTVHRCIGVFVKANSKEEAKALAIEAGDSDIYEEEWENTNTEVYYQPEEKDIDEMDDEDVDKIFEE